MDIQEKRQVKKGLTGFQIKLLALIFMLFDHIHYFFEFTGKVPIIFSWIGRLAAGLFLFTLVEGYIHTSNKKKYFVRIYFLSIFMGVLKFLFQTMPNLQRGDGFFAENGILSTFAILIIMFRGIDYIKEKQILKGLALLSLFFITTYIIFWLPPSLQLLKMFLFYTVLPSPFMVEGGMYIIIPGLIMYIFHKNRKLQCILYGIFILIWMGILPFIYIKSMSLKLMFTTYYEWMAVFSIVFMLLYNGGRGRNMKKLFYIFYPAHIYILYGLSILIFNLMY